MAAADGTHRSHQEPSYLSRSRYEQQLQRLMRLFDPDQVFVRRSEDLFNQPEQLWDDVLRFLEVSHCALPQQGRWAHAGRRTDVDMEKDDQYQQERLRLHALLQPTYTVMRKRYGLVWDNGALC